MAKKWSQRCNPVFWAKDVRIGKVVIYSSRAEHCRLLLRKSALTRHTFAERKATIIKDSLGDADLRKWEGLIDRRVA